MTSSKKPLKEKWKSVPRNQTDYTRADDGFASRISRSARIIMGRNAGPMHREIGGIRRLFRQSDARIGSAGRVGVCI
jgi:hypothetical protein